MRTIEYLSNGSWVALHGPKCLGEHLSEATLVQSANAIGSLTLRFLPTSGAVDKIACNTLVRVYNDGEKEWEFYGRVIDVTPGMDDDGTVYKEAVCEDALGFLQDTAVWIDSRKAYFDGSNSSYPVEIDDEDGSRTMASATLAKLVVGQHNNTVADSGGDAWKQVRVGTVSASGETTFSAEYEATTYEMLSAVADDASAEFRSRYDGTNTYIDMAPSLGCSAGTFAVGDNVAQTALKTSMADVVTRMFPYGDEYAKLEKIRRKGTKVTGALKGSDWQTSKGTMLRFPCEGALKCVLKVGARNKDYAMVVFASAKLTKSNAEDAVVRKYTTKRTTGENLTRRYPVPEGAKYVYVYGRGSTCTTYGYYRNKAGNAVKKNYRTDLAFWKSKLTASELDSILDYYGVTMGSVVDGSNDRSYYIAMNEDRYGAVEGTCMLEGQLNTDKIENARKAVYSISDLKATKARARRFVKHACKQLKSRCTEAVELTVTGYDLAAAGLSYDALKLYDRWRVTNSLCGIDHTAEVVRVRRDLLQPWNVEVELGSKVERATGAGKGTSASLTAGIKPGAAGDDDDSAEDEYATLAGQYADAAEKAAEEAVEKADELDQLSYLIQVDSLAAGQMASDAYDTVLPITDAMRGLLSDAQDQADSLTSVKESQSKTVSLANDLARAQASYAYETEKSVVRWKQTYTADLDAWASEDPEVQAEIAAAYKLLYGANGTAEKPEADSAQGHLNAAKAANVEAASTEAEMRVELASANAYLASCESAADKAAAAAQKAQKAYDALKKKTTAKRKELDAAKAARDAALAKEAAAKEKVDGANVRCAEAEANYTAAKEALADAEAKVATAQAEVDTAMNGIHEKYQSTIEQTAKSVKLSASKVGELDSKVGSLEVSAESVKSDVQTLDSKTQALMKATNMTQTDSGFTWSIVDNTARNAASDAANTASNAVSTASSAASTANSAYSMAYNIVNGTGTLTLGGSAAAINLANVVTISTGKDSSGNSAVTFTMSSGYPSAKFSGAVDVSGDITAASVQSNGMIMTSSAIYAGGNITSEKQINSKGSYMNVNIGPKTSGGASCGSNTYKWSKVYAETGTIQTSSIHTKENIEPVTDEKASRLLDVNVVKFDYTLDHWKREKGRKGWYGVIAEEVHDLFPEVVLDWDTETEIDERTGEEVKVYPGVTYEGFIPHLIKLCQMQQAQIDGLKARVEALEANQNTTE